MSGQVVEALALKRLFISSVLEIKHRYNSRLTSGKAG
jgi:hypothetical protein